MCVLPGKGVKGEIVITVEGMEKSGRGKKVEEVEEEEGEE